MKLYNTLTRLLEEFKPIKDERVGMYTCGPTVYSYPQIGNWRTFTFEDLLRRVLEYNGYKVNHVMNVTDVGHLTGDNLGDADLGEDRMEKAATREGKSAWEVAQFYLDDFVASAKKLNLLPPTHLPRATDHIAEQIALIEKLEKKVLTYQTDLGVYFNVSKYPDYGKLGGQKLVDKRTATREELKEDPQKKNPFDFALWKFSKPQDKRQMEWDSPWGKGFRGWHIECSAMSMKYLGESFDIHTGGVDHVAIHHTNEIAQSEGATGKPFAKYWLHGEFLTVDGGRMGKSLGNAYTLAELMAKNYDPLSLRYLYLTTHYRKVMNFTFEALDGAQTAFNKLRKLMGEWKENKSRTALSTEKDQKINEFRQKFTEALNDDLNIPQALAVVWEVAKSNIPGGDKYDLMANFDEVLGLDLNKVTNQTRLPDGQVQNLIDKRDELRVAGKYAEADAIRDQLQKLGFAIQDKKD